MKVIRPAQIRIERTYSIDGEKRELKVDNVEGSQDLLDDVKNDISEEDYENLESVTVGVRDETNGTKTYITYDAK